MVTTQRGNETPATSRTGARRCDASSGEARAAEAEPAGDDAVAFWQAVGGLVREAVVSIDADGRIEFFNRGAERLFGWTAPEVAGRSFEQLIAPRSRRLYRVCVRRLKASRSAARAIGRKGELAARPKDGAPFPIEARLFRFGKGGGGGLVVVAHKGNGGAAAGEPAADVDAGRLGFLLKRARDLASELAKHEAAERIRQDREARLQAILDVALDGIVTIDAEGTILSFNQAAAQMFGHDPEDVIGRDVSVLMPEPYHSRHAGYIAGYLRTGEKKIIGIGREVQGLRKDGSVFPLHLAVSEAKTADGTLFVGVLRDLGEQKRTQQALRDSEARLANAIKLIGEGFAIFDADDRLWLYNEAWVRILSGIREMLAPGVTFEELLRAAVRRGLIVDAAGQEDAYLRERMERHRHPAGPFHTLRSDGTCVIVHETRMPDGGTVVALTDISELKHEQCAAETANRAKSDFLSKMSHELRTPLNAILGYAQILEAHSKDSLTAQQRSHVGRISLAGQHLLDLINDILDLAKIESGQVALAMEDVDLGGLIEDCATVARTIADRGGIKLIETWTAGATPTVRADPVRLKQALLNLLSNAVKYNRPDGSVTLACEAPSACRARISVADTGIGIPAARRSELFKPFSRLGAETSAIEGTGIGLALTKELIERMGGAVGFEGREGEGSTFWIELPVGCGAPAEPPVGRTPMALGNGAARKGWRKTVLYVEDNLSNRMLMEEIATNVLPFDLVTANDGRSGVALAETLRPDLILMDINLPDMNGFEALERLRASDRTRSIPVIALTADAMPDNVRRGGTAGFRGYLTKPLAISDFARALDAVFGRDS